MNNIRLKILMHHPMKKITISIPTIPLGFVKKKRVYIPLLILSSMAFGIGVFLSYQNLQNYFKPVPKAENNINTPPQQVLGLVESVGKHISDVPNNEFPNVATVSDIDRLSDQAFFEGAQKGDKVLIYTGNKKAYLYRPSTDTVIRSGSVEMVKEDTVESASKSATATDAAVLRVKY